MGRFRPIDPRARWVHVALVTEAQAVEAIMEHWEEQWEELHPSDPAAPDYVPFTLDNEAFTGVDKWARVTIVNTTRTQTTSGPKGSNRIEQRGRIAVQLFADIDRGALELAQLADDVRTVFECEAIPVSATGQEIAVFEGSSSPVPTDKRWNMSVVVIPFLYYSTR